LAPGQAAVVVELQRKMLLPLDDLVAVVREFINPEVSRSGLDSCLRRHGVASPRELRAQARPDTVSSAVGAHPATRKPTA
jgi:hypothetical protein